MTYENIIQDLKQKKYHPVYFLMGDEPYFIDKITDYIADNVLKEAEKSFDQSIIYGKDTDMPTIINMAKRYPMMSEYQVVIVKEAQNIKKIEDLVYYLDKPQQKTILVFSYKYGKINKNKKIYKSLKKNALLFISDKLYENKIPAWISSYLSGKNYNISPATAMLLVEFLGNDLSKIATELEKLIITLPNGQTTITKEHIEKNIGISKDYNNYELQKALSTRNLLKANKIIQYFSANQKKNPIVVTITSLYFYFNKIFLLHFLKDKSENNIAATLKIHPFFVKDYTSAAKLYNPKKVANIITMLRQYDLKSKGVNNISVSDGDLLKELVHKILH